ncbi:hypothetical protein SEVIR_6G033313v4 [Setaria viridis]
MLLTLIIGIDIKERLFLLTVTIVLQKKPLNFFLIKPIVVGVVLHDFAKKKPRGPPPPGRPPHPPSGSGMVHRLFSHAAAAGTTPWLPASASHSCLAGSCAQPQSQAAYGARPPSLAGDPACLRSRRASALVLLWPIGQACWPSSGHPSGNSGCLSLRRAAGAAA